MNRNQDDGINEVVLARARAIHAEVCGCDNPRCPTRQEVYDWLEDGDQGEGRTTADLVAEWREREAEADAGAVDLPRGAEDSASS